MHVGLAKILSELAVTHLRSMYDKKKGFTVVNPFLRDNAER